MAIVKRMKKDGTPSYQVVVSRRDTVTGKRKQSVVGTYRIKKDAQKAERKALDSIEESRFVERSSETVADLLTAWVNHKTGKVSAKTMSDYQIVIDRHLLPTLGNAPAQGLRAYDLQVWFDLLDVGDRTKERTLAVLKQAYNFAAGLGLVAASPCTAIVIKKSVPDPPILWNDDQFLKFLDVTIDDMYDPIWPLICWTGVRYGEGAGLYREYTDLGAKAITISHQLPASYKGNYSPEIVASTKTEAGKRVITIPDVLVERIERAYELRMVESPLVCCTPEGKPIYNNPARVQLHKICDRAKIPYLHPHGIRHLHATHLARAGVPIRVAMDRLGHANPATLLRIYQHVEQGMRADVVDKLAALFPTNANQDANGHMQDGK